MRTVYDLMCRVASHLAQKPVRVRLRKPQGASGACRVDSSGVVTIDISPEYSDRTELKVFLHELAHARFDKFIPMELEVSESISVKDSPVVKLIETRAEAQAEAWLRFAEKNRDRNLDYFEGCLFSLLEF